MEPLPERKHLHSEPALRSLGLPSLTISPPPPWCLMGIVCLRQELHLLGSVTCLRPRWSLGQLGRKLLLLLLSAPCRMTTPPHPLHTQPRPRPHPQSHSVWDPSEVARCGGGGAQHSAMWPGRPTRNPVTLALQLQMNIHAAGGADVWGTEACVCVWGCDSLTLLVTRGWAPGGGGQASR